MSEATLEAKENEDPDSFFATLMKKTTPAASEAPGNAVASAVNPPPTAKVSSPIPQHPCEKLKTDKEVVQAEKKAVEDQILLLQLRLTQLDDKLTDLSSQKKVLYQTMKTNRTVYEKLEGKLPLLSSSKSELENELAETEKVWLNFRAILDSL
ncbi:hypothetical protein Acr_00g0066650 [Actinidia rufa]|uniref:Uncharacterized protein n=1 Tax=Actinidia rufa TaxID=165716 RepID=A0A7J0DRY3_9ERIC|nr:hypothetical protein Acr_00g0066650 [Actinidia rufa]